MDGPAMSEVNKVLTLDLDGFSEEISRLRKKIKQEAGIKELNHFKKIELLVWTLTLVGFATIWLEPNPLSIFILAAASLGNASIMGHHIAHRSFDAIEGAPRRFNSSVFSIGYRKIFEWFDWIDMEAWKHEHNKLHHYSLGEDLDPDTPQDNAFWLTSGVSGSPCRRMQAKIFMPLIPQSKTRGNFTYVRL